MWYVNYFFTEFKYRESQIGSLTSGSPNPALCTKSRDYCLLSNQLSWHKYVTGRNRVKMRDQDTFFVQGQHYKVESGLDTVIFTIPWVLTALQITPLSASLLNLLFCPLLCGLFLLTLMVFLALAMPGRCSSNQINRNKSTSVCQTSWTPCRKCIIKI